MPGWIGQKAYQKKFPESVNLTYCYTESCSNEWTPLPGPVGVAIVLTTGRKITVFVPGHVLYTSVKWFTNRNTIDDFLTAVQRAVCIAKQQFSKRPEKCRTLDFYTRSYGFCGYDQSNNHKFALTTPKTWPYSVAAVKLILTSLFKPLATKSARSFLIYKCVYPSTEDLVKRLVYAKRYEFFGPIGPQGQCMVVLHGVNWDADEFCPINLFIKWTAGKCRKPAYQVTFSMKTQEVSFLCCKELLSELTCLLLKKTNSFLQHAAAELLPIAEDMSPTDTQVLFTNLHKRKQTFDQHTGTSPVDSTSADIVNFGLSRGIKILQLNASKQKFIERRNHFFGQLKRQLSGRYDSCYSYPPCLPNLNREKADPRSTGKTCLKCPFAAGSRQTMCGVVAGMTPVDVMAKRGSTPCTKNPAWIKTDKGRFEMAVLLYQVWKRHQSDQQPLKTPRL